MNNTEVMLEAARKKWDEIGEKHGYTGVVHGAAEVLRRHGFETTGEELARLFHDPLSEYHGQMEKETLTFEELARGMDLGSRGSHEVRLSFPLNNIHERSQFPYPLDRVPDINPDLSWIVKEIGDHLKAKKIRRNTKRWNEFYSSKENADRVVHAAEEIAEKSIEKAKQQYEKNIKELDELHDKTIESIEYVARRAAIRRAFVETAGRGPGNAKVNALEEGTLAALEDVKRKIEEHAAYLERSIGEKSARDAAVEALARRKETKPFLDAAGISYAHLPHWMVASDAA